MNPVFMRVSGFHGTQNRGSGVKVEFKPGSKVGLIAHYRKKIKSDAQNSPKTGRK
jgi:hypothetical protein